MAPLTAREPGAVELDRGYDNEPSRALLVELGLEGVIARKGVPAPIQARSRWKVERTHSWMNGYGKLRRCTEKRRRWWTSTCSWPLPWWSSAGSSRRPAPATAGQGVPPSAASGEPPCPGALNLRGSSTTRIG